MKTLRLFRNIAALFILVAVSLISHPSVGHSTGKTGCTSTFSATNCVCTVNPQGNVSCKTETCPSASNCSYLQATAAVCQKPCL